MTFRSNSSGQPGLTTRNFLPQLATIHPIECISIKGTIPKWLSGTLIRNGPGITQIGESRYNHVFDGLSVLHKFTIKHGKITYQNRPLDSDTYKRNMNAQRIVVTELGTLAATYTDPCQTIFQRWKSIFSSFTEEVTDNTNVNVAYIGGSDKLFALSEVNHLRQIDPNTLETIGDKTNLSDHTSLVTATAHPQLVHISETKEDIAINVGMSFNARKLRMEYLFIKIPSSNNSECFENARILAKIPARWTLYPSYFHSFGITQNAKKAVFIEQPLCINLPKIPVIKIKQQPASKLLELVPNQCTLIHVVNLKDESHNTQDTASKNSPISVRFEAKDLFVFHHINCFEDIKNRVIILDVAAYKDAKFVLNDMTPDENTFSQLKPRRYILPVIDDVNYDDIIVGSDLILNSFNHNESEERATAVVTEKLNKNLVISVTSETLHSEWLELPQINPKYNGRKYTYLYGISGPPILSNIPMALQISKLDTTTGNRLNYFPKESSSRSLYLSEPIFIPRSHQLHYCKNDIGHVECEEEDDGVILTVALSELDPTYVALIILDAKTMEELAVAKFHATGVVTPTLHGIWTHSAF